MPRGCGQHGAMQIGCFLSCEEFGPRDLVEQAKRAEQAGFRALWISDHYHPWNDEQGPVHAGTKVCFMADEDEARKTVHRLWPNEGLPGELAQILPTPSHFEQACELVTPEQLQSPMGPDLDVHAASLQEYADAGVDELFVQQIGPEQDAFFTTWAKEILPRFSEGR